MTALTPLRLLGSWLPLERIAPGVVSIKEGAWFTPDEGGVDRRGCANVLTDDRSAPCGATTYNTCLVEVEPAQGAS